MNVEQALQLSLFHGYYERVISTRNIHFTGF